MSGRDRNAGGFSLIELLIVIAVVGILAALLFTVLDRVKAKAKRAVCTNHVRQIALGVRMYADDMNDASPARFSGNHSVDGWTAYKELIKGYVGQNTASSPEDRLFSCPADTYHYDFTATSTSAYAYVGQAVHRQA